MPCVQAKERQQREAYTRANRRDVDPYGGIDDPLEILKLVHSPPKPDPLIRYAPPPRQPAALYAELGSGQIAALVRHAHSLLKKGDTHRAQDIAACIVAFVCADISSLLQELIRIEELRPEFVFHRAAPKIRNLLTQHLARVAGHDGCSPTSCCPRWRGWETSAWSISSPVGGLSRRVGVGSAHSPAPVCARGRLGAVARRPATKSVSRDLLSADTQRRRDNRLVSDRAHRYESARDRWHVGGARFPRLPAADRRADRRPHAGGRSAASFIGPSQRYAQPLARGDGSLPTQYSQIGGHPTWVQTRSTRLAAAAPGPCLSSARSPARTSSRIERASSTLSSVPTA